MKVEQIEILKAFANKIYENAEQLDPEIPRIVSENFWELVYTDEG